MLQSLDSLNEKERAVLDGLDEDERQYWARFIKQIRAVKPGTYNAHGIEFIIISDLSEGDAFNAAYDFFRYGFLKGQRAAKAEAKRRAAK